jgi:hypothetical protein
MFLRSCRLCHATKPQGLSCLLFPPLLALTLTIAALLVVLLTRIFPDEHLPAFLAPYDHLLVRDKDGKLIFGGSYQGVRSVSEPEITNRTYLGSIFQQAAGC